VQRVDRGFPEERGEGSLSMQCVSIAPRMRNFQGH
jgi:hypothetical protein